MSLEKNCEKQTLYVELWWSHVHICLNCIGTFIRKSFYMFTCFFPSVCSNSSPMTKSEALIHKFSFGFLMNLT